MLKRLFIIVPCYNEEDVLEFTAKTIKQKIEELIQLQKISQKSRILFVNDGSKDSTWNIIKALNKENKLFAGISLSRNHGHQNALLAGIDTAIKYSDIMISMDADLQDDINAIDEMIDAYNNGNEIVYAVRSSRRNDTFFKRSTAQAFYHILSLLGAEIVYNHADYRLLSKKAAQALLSFSEVNLFLRGIVPLIGFQSTTVEYQRNSRHAGKSKYPLAKMIAFALEGITSLSIKPIRIITTISLLILLVSVVMFIKILADYFTGNVIVGWASTTASIWFLGGLQTFAIGIIGEYIGKTYLETKKRPRFIVESVLLDDE